jgi:chitodextrinase
MNRFLAPLTPRGSFKRASALLIALFFLAGTAMLLIPTKADAAACAPPAQDYGTATIFVNIPSTTTYRIWSRIMAPDASSNSYLLEVDGNTCYVVGDSAIAANTWTWVDYQNGSTPTKVEQSLSAGNHSLKLIGREPNVKISRLLFVSDLNCTPSGNGDNCAVAGDTEVPSVTVTAPAQSATVSGTTNVTATASDNVAVTKVEFYVNGTLKATDTTSPYAYAWDSKTAANGTASLTAKAYDAAGNTGSSTVQVNVLNGDTQAPSVPNGVTAAANSPTKVTVNWNASTDNVGVAGYWVSRNNVTVANVTSGTQYVDNAALPGNTYAYKVTAYDATGNTSAASASASATTPNPPQPDTQAPSAPGGLSAQAASQSQINLSWSASTDNVGVAGYEVYRKVGGGGPVKVATVNTTSFGDSGLAPATTYAYYVVARDSAGNTSGNSNTAEARTQAQKGHRGVIRGRVTLARGQQQPITVTVTARGVKQIATADSAGNYAVGELPPGTYRVRYQAPSHYSKVVTVKVKTDQVKTLNVKLRKR